MGKLATSKFIYDTFSLGTSSSRFPTKSEIVNLGLTVSGSYTNNLLVLESDLSYEAVIQKYITFQFSFADVEYFDKQLYDHVNLNYNWMLKFWVSKDYQLAYIISYIIKNSTIEILDKVIFRSSTATKNGNIYTFSTNIKINSNYDTYLALGDSQGNIYEPDYANNFLRVKMPETNNAWHYTFARTLDFYIKLKENINSYYFEKVTNTTNMITFNTLSFLNKEVYVKIQLEDNLDIYSQFEYRSSASTTNGLSSYIYAYGNTYAKVTTSPISTYIDYIEEDGVPYLQFIANLDVSLTETTYLAFDLEQTQDIILTILCSDRSIITLTIPKYSLGSFNYTSNILAEEIDDTTPEWELYIYPEEIYIS